jgi:RNA polymerase sigma factor (sigma-70 family)
MTPSSESQSDQDDRLDDALEGDEQAELPRRRRFAPAAMRMFSDERLARLAAKGDRTAFAAIFDRYHEDLYRYCLSLLRNSEDAADALQTAMLRALRSLHGDERQIALRPWLYRIAHNESITLLRRRPRSASAGEAAPGFYDVEADAEVRARLDTLLTDLRDLPERQRGALVMREMAGLDYGDIADALDTSPAGAKQAVYDARRALYAMAEGREADCDVIRKMISDGDRRVLRGRMVRAHLGSCEECRAFRAQVIARRSGLTALTPTMPIAMAVQALQGALAGSGAGAGGSAGFLAGLGTTAAAAPAAAMAVAVALGAGAVGVTVGVSYLDEREHAAQTRGAVAAVATGGGRLGVVSEPAGKRADSRSVNSDRSRAARERARARRRASRKRDAEEERSGSAEPAGNAGGAIIGGGGSGPATRLPRPPIRGGDSRLRPGRPGHGDGPIRGSIHEIRQSIGDAVGEVRDGLPAAPPSVPDVLPRRPRVAAAR